MSITPTVAKALEKAANGARYTGSPYHRLPSSRLGKPASRQWPVASKCDSEWTQEAATNALRAAIRAGSVSEDWKSGFPCIAWHKQGDTLYEARLSNSGLGEYHAYPLESPLEWPSNIK